MKYPVTVTADGFDLRWPRSAVPSILVDAWRFTIRHWGLLAALAITFLINAPTLRYFFSGDDLVVAGSIRYSGTGQYLLDTVRMQDIVPSWRPLTAVVYAAEWNMFGLNAMGWRAVNLSIHLGSLVLLYALMMRVTRRPAIGAIAALFFGVSGAHFDTVTYVTALPHVLATFFVLGSLLAIIIYAQEGERNPGLFALSFALFALAFLTNEGSFVFAPVIVAAYLLFSRRWTTALWRAPAHAVPFVALAAGWLAFYESCSCNQLKFQGYEWGPHVPANYAVYLSWLVFPSHAIPKSPDDLRWILAAILVVGGVIAAVRGPAIARIAVLGVALALLPYAPVRIWTASRYTYTAVAFFAPLAAIACYALYEAVLRSSRRARMPATIAGIALIATVAALYGWQSHAQDARSGRENDRWLRLVNELQKNYATVPPGTTIYIIDGPWTAPMEQYTWVPSTARVVYGDAAAFDLTRADFEAAPPDPSGALFLQWTADGLRPVTAPEARAPQ